MSTDVLVSPRADEDRPGEHLVWRGDDGERRPAVVQTFNPYQRIAELVFLDTNEKQTVSVLELDPGDHRRNNYGVGFGQQVLLCPDNGAQLPEVPSLGQHGAPVEHNWMGDELQRMYGEHPLDMFWPEGEKQAVSWWGEVVQLHLDGTVSVKLGDGESRRVGIKNVQLLHDCRAALEENMDGWGPVDEEEFMYGSESGMGSEASWETMSRREPGEGMDMDEEVNADMELDEEEERERREIEEVEPVVSDAAVQNAVGDPQTIDMSEPGPSFAYDRPLPKSSLKGDDRWQHFEMLEEAPQDHHFIGQPSNEATSKTYHSRIHREHRALMSSLPGAHPVGRSD